MRTRARGTGALAALAAVTLLAACAGGEPEGIDETSGAGESPAADELVLQAGSHVIGLPEGAGEQPADAVVGAGRTTDDGLVYVVTFGSSTCPSVPVATARETGTASVEVTFPDPGSGPCTADYVPATAVVALPDVIDPEQDLTVTIGTSGEVVLPAGSDELVWVTASE